LSGSVLLTCVVTTFAFSGTRAYRRLHNARVTWKDGRAPSRSLPLRGYRVSKLPRPHHALFDLVSEVCQLPNTDLVDDLVCGTPAVGVCPDSGAFRHDGQPSAVSIDDLDHAAWHDEVHKSSSRAPISLASRLNASPRRASCPTVSLSWPRTSQRFLRWAPSPLMPVLSSSLEGSGSRSLGRGGRFGRAALQPLHAASLGSRSEVISDELRRALPFIRDLLVDPSSGLPRLRPRKFRYKRSRLPAVLVWSERLTPGGTPRMSVRRPFWRSCLVFDMLAASARLVSRRTQVSETPSEDDLTFEITSVTLRVATHGLTSASFGGPTSKYGCYVPRRRVSLGAPNDVGVPTDSWTDQCLLWRPDIQIWMLRPTTTRKFGRTKRCRRPDGPVESWPSPTTSKLSLARCESPFGLMGSGRGRSTYGRPSRPSLQESETPLIASIFLSSSMVPIRQPCGTTWATRAGVPFLRGRSASRACSKGLLLPDVGTA
jgi:hypothetical protein